jgi:patatin-like phospholipase/acyl hydrolase
MPKAKSFRILSIDGGGIRGIIPAAVMIEIERQVREAKKDPNIKIGECFDLVAGTSTGGILTLMLLAPDPDAPKKARFSASDALELYTEHGDEIFDRSIKQKIGSLWGLSDEKYSAGVLEQLLRRYFGDTKLSELIRPCLVTAYNAKKYQPFFFTQHDAIADKSREFYVREAARATSAAPTYFEAAEAESLDDIPNAVPMLDGGVFANNPAACALVEAMRLKPGIPLSLDKISILSLGTGRRPKSLTYHQIKDWGLAGWARPIIDILLEGNAQTVDYELKTIFESAKLKANYLRIDGNFGDVQAGLDIEGLDSDMDDASPANMRRLETFGRQLAHNCKKEIGAFLKKFLV